MENDKKKILVKALKRASRQEEIEKGATIKGGAHKSKKKYSRKDKHKKNY